MAHIEARAKEAEGRRQALRDEARRRHDAWDHAVAAARDRYVAAFNRQRLDDQLARHDRAQRLRAFASEVMALAAAQSDADLAARMNAWAQLMLDEAGRIDPRGEPADLQIVEPDTIPSVELDRYMPPGMSALRPPEVPD